jgi:hypothetical protein
LNTAGRAIIGCIALVGATLVGLPAGASGGQGDTASYWTAARRDAAQPRDLVVDQRGLGYLRRADGSLVPHGHTTPAERPRVYAAPAGPSSPTPMARPPAGDTTGPSISGMDPAAGATIGTSYTFRATVSDPSGVRTVTFVVVYPDGRTQSFSASASGTTWSTALSGFTAGSWSWYVRAKDGAKGGGNISTSPTVAFTVGSGGGGGGDVVTNAQWTFDGAVRTAAGRIYFEMPSNTLLNLWDGYVCSGTAVQDGTTGRSIIITAAHCVYDDAHKAFARNVLFIPDQAHSTAGTDLNCGNDPLGCWAPKFGVVDSDWTTRTFPDNVAWDYAYYVVNDTGAHSGTAASSDALDAAAGTLPVQFTAPSTGSVTHALGYSYSDDPNFMYCAEAMGTEGTVNWWLPSCGLSGGSSGGPWVQPMNTSTGSGPIISVNSWGYTNQPGMAGPKLAGTSASCLFGVAKTASLTTSGGVASNCA